MSALIKLLFIVIVASSVFAFGAIIGALIFSRPKRADNVDGDLLILAAHQDDCVIMAGEFAVHVAEQSGNVKVAYLTCGDSDRNSERAKVRREEALRAWGMIGVPKEDIFFLGLPAAKTVEGPCLITPADKEIACRTLRTLVNRLPERSTIFIPADGEAHVDHRLLRAISLAIIKELPPEKYDVYEAAEYNCYYSLFRGPGRALSYVLKCMPVFSRFSWLSHRTERAHFPSGPRPLSLPPNMDRLNKKIEMLRQFRSEGTELLVKYFGHPDRFRPIDRAQLLPSRDLYTWISGRYVGLSVVAVWLSILGSLFLTTLLGTWHLRQTVPVTLGVSLNACIVVAMFYFALRERRVVERRAMDMATGAGAALSLFL
jgi:LmbE family N-acetylglucosaminyl deacetylase